ncbi:MAG: DUF4236 domain-containing protein [Prevotella sp.]|jgi:hypothetical protein|nr:DUF4236 domain-containing protein [Prevotella sp.]
MAWSYRKRIKIIPGVHLNLGKNGVSTTIGVRGASITFGTGGTYINTGIPGTGIYNRQKISGNRNSFTPDNIDNSPISCQPVEDRYNIFSADIQEITSQGMQRIKDAIIAAQEQRKELVKDQLQIRSSLKKSQFKLMLGYIFLYGFIKKTVSENHKTDIDAQRNAIEQLTGQINDCCVEVNIDFDPEIKEKYETVIRSFMKLSASHKIWDVTATRSEDERITRSAVSTAITRKNARLGRKTLVDIRSEYEPLWIENANGGDLYIYPNFIIMYSSRQQFAVIGFDELDLRDGAVRFVETGTVPSDAQIVDRTWAKVNKNGSPDKRFKNNYQIPVVKYGEIRLATKTGVNEEYQFSNFEATNEFACSFKEYQKTITSLDVIS